METSIKKWKYDVANRPKTEVDEFGFLVKDKEEPIENVITWVFERKER